MQSPKTIAWDCLDDVIQRQNATTPNRATVPTIIGIVGAGGIGLLLSEMIRTLEWQAVAFIVLLILAIVAALDAVSGRLRAAIAGAPAWQAP